MEDNSTSRIESILKTQQTFFSTHQTKELGFRIEQLKKLRAALLKYEQEINDALWTDLHKSPEEAFLTETSLVLQEIKLHLKNIKRWTRSRKVSTPFPLLPSSSQIIYEPLGVALIIAPWNYPFQLLFKPLVGAISSGCCTILKPSPYTPTVAKVMDMMIKETFSPEYINVIQGGREANKILLDQKFDFIFFTGSPSLGKIVMKAAAEHLCPVVLELGGKSPCIVDRDANVNIAAKRIAWGKTINAGQTCIAPDYLLVHDDIKAALIQKIAANIEKMYGPDIKKSNFFPRIVNEEAMKRLEKLMKHGSIKFGGETDKEQRYIAPTIIDNVMPDFPIMQEEIFGPLLPVISFKNIEEAIDLINSKDKPLAIYYFGAKRNAKNVLFKTSSGGGCINDTILQIANHKLPYGGVGSSGMGRYNGYESFRAFSNQKGFVKSSRWIDIPLKYVPFKNFKLLKKIL